MSIEIETDIRFPKIWGHKNVRLKTHVMIDEQL